MFFGLNWLDLAIICILLFGIFDGMNKGFILSFFNIAGIFISLYLSRFFMSILSDYLIKNTLIYENLKQIFVKRMSGINSISMSILKLFNIKGNSASDSVTIAFIDVACFILIFFISSIIINIFKDMLRSKVKKSALKHVDKLLGGAIGLTVAVIFIFIFFAVLIPLTAVMPKDSSIVIAIGASKIAKYFFYFNFLIPWIQKVNKSEVITTLLDLIRKFS